MALFKKTSTKPKRQKAVTAKDASYDFINASRAFEQSRIREVEKSKVLAWRVAFGACAIAVINAIAIIGLTPLKTVQPYVIRYDNNTGGTDIVTMFSGIENESQAELSAKYFAAMYVNLLEGYDWYTLQDQVNKLMMFSNKDMQQRISNKFSMPDAPHKVYENDKRIEVAVNNVSVVNMDKGGTSGLMQVRFTKAVVPTNGGSYNIQEQVLVPAPEVKKYIATIGFEYVKTPAVDDVRLINPFGFTVVSYRVDEEFGG